jgi:hypothetical protein
MSRVTNVIITTCAGEDETAEALNRACVWNDAIPFRHVPSSHVAGDKHLECNVFTGAFNHLDLLRLIQSVSSVRWNYPESVQLFVLEEESERFRELDLFPGGRACGADRRRG